MILGLFIKGINERKGLKYAIFVNLIWLVTSSSQYVNPKYVVIVWAPLLFYLIFYSAVSKDRSESFRSLRFTLILFCLWALVNIYWILPTISYSAQIITAPGSLYSAIGRSRLQDFTLNSASLPDALRLLGSWLLTSGFSGYPYVYWAPTFSTTLFIFIGYLVPLIAFLPLIFKREKNILFFSIFLVAALLFMNGTQPPFGKLNIYLFTHIPLAIDVFSLPYVFFGLYAIIGFAVLFGYGTVLLSNCLAEKRSVHLSRKLKTVSKPIIAGIIIFLVIGLYAFPIWTGEVAYTGNALLSSSRYQIPNYYNEASAWLSSDPSDFRLFSLPYSIIGYVSYSWEPGGYQGSDPTASLLGRSVIVSSEDGDLGSTIAQLIVSNSTVEVAKILALMNVKYIVFHNDVNWQFLNDSAGQDVIASYISTSQQNFKTILASQDGFTFCKSFGQLDFYINNYWQPMMVYPASKGILSDGNLNQLIQISERNDFTPSNSVILLSNQLDAEQISTLPINTEFIENPDTNLTYYPISGAQTDGRRVDVLNSQPIATAKYYSSWAGIISTNGHGNPGMIVFSSPSECPYLSAFPENLTGWSAYNSTLIYITSGTSPLIVYSITADDASVPATAWWQTGTSWITGWPITIPSNQNAIIQVDQQASNITLQTDNGPIALSVTNGWTNPLTSETPYELPTTIVTPNSSDYLLAIDVATGSGYGNLPLKIDGQSFIVDLNSQDQGPVFDYKYIGPIQLTAGSHTITTSEGNVSTSQIDSMLLYSLENKESFVNADNLLSSK